MTASENDFQWSQAEILILNALTELQRDETTILDEESETHLQNAVNSCSPHDRSTAENELRQLADIGEDDSIDVTPEVYQYVSTVTDRLASEGYTISVRHEYTQELNPIDARVYTFMNTREVDELADLDTDPTVLDHIRQGTAVLEEGTPEEATSAFSQAVSRADSHTDRIVTNVLLGWAHFLAGEYDTATEHVQEALELDDSSWAAHIVGTMLDVTDKSPVQSGDKSVGLILRWVVEGSENTSVNVRHGTTSNRDSIEWTDVEQSEGHSYLDRVYPDNHIQFELLGELPDFPTLHTYYMGVGLFNNDTREIETVHHRFGSGPAHTDTVETVRIRK